LNTATIGKLAVLSCVLALAACSSKGDPSIGAGQTANITTADFQIAYIKRVLPTDPVDVARLVAADDLRQKRNIRSKADVYIRDKASPSGVERNITARITGNNFYDVRDLDVSPDGTRLVFAMRGPLTATQQETAPPTWAIWEYVVASDTLRRIIPDDVTANAGQDISPHYLPDGRILFSSTRQRDAKSILIDEGKSGFEAQAETGNQFESSFLLHVMDSAGTLGSIHQVSYDQGSDTDASLLADGRVMWTRWDNATGNGAAGMALYSAHPDGADLQLLYGARSHATGTPTAAGTPSTVQFARAREMQDGKVIALVRPFGSTDFGSQLVIIDVRNYVENGQRTLAGASASVAAAGPAQTPVTQADIRTIAGPSPGGRFNSAFPLWDGTRRVLVSWSQCRLLDATNAIVPCTQANIDAGLATAPPLYSAWLLSLDDGTLKPVITPVEGDMIEDIVSLQARDNPGFIADTQPAQALAPDLGVGILDIRSVYDFDGAPWPGLGTMTLAQVAALPAAQRPARFLRITKAVSLPSQQVLNFNRNLAFGRAGNFMREILGYVPIEPDGSVRARIPANVAFNVEVVDANGRRIFAPNRVWQQLRPGEIGDCNGCYYAPAAPVAPATVGLSHGRKGLFASLNAGASGGACPGETSAQNKSGWNCNGAPYAAPPLSMNVLFNGAPTGDADITLRYNDLNTPLPTRSGCLTAWSSACRSTISYPLVLKQLWYVARGVAGADTCVNCHNSAILNAANQIKQPGEQLNLTDDAAQATPALQSQRSYDQLTQGYTYVIAQPDPNNPGQFIAVAAPGTWPASISAGSANASTRFFSIFAATGTHAGRLSPAELRLLSEWIDIGTQYYNNPFDAPLN